MTPEMFRSAKRFEAWAVALDPENEKEVTALPLEAGRQRQTIGGGQSCIRELGSNDVSPNGKEMALLKKRGEE